VQFEQGLPGGHQTARLDAERAPLLCASQSVDRLQVAADTLGEDSEQPLVHIQRPPWCAVVLWCEIIFAQVFDGGQSNTARSRV